MGCARLHGEEKGKYTCDAFPKGIPEDILLSKADHRQPFPDDRDLQFLPNNDEAARYAQLLFEPSRG